MHHFSEDFGSVKFTDWAMLGSHDSVTGYGNTGEPIAPLTITQDKPLDEQAKCGARYFDIRPFFTENGEITGHHGDPEKPWLGVSKPMSEYIDELVRFANENPNVEDLLVIGIFDYVNWKNEKTDEQKQAVIKLLEEKGVKVIVDDCKGQLGEKTLQEVWKLGNEKLGDGKGSIIALVGPGAAGGLDGCMDGNDRGPRCCKTVGPGIECCDGQNGGTSAMFGNDMTGHKKNEMKDYLTSINKGGALLSFAQLLWRNPATAFEVPAWTEVASAPQEIVLWHALEGGKRTIVSENRGSNLLGWFADELKSGAIPPEMVGGKVNVFLADNVCTGGPAARDAILEVLKK